MVIIRNGDVETAITAFSEQSKDRLREFGRHQYFSPSHDRRKPAMHKKPRDSKGRKRK